MTAEKQELQPIQPPAETGSVALMRYTVIRQYAMDEPTNIWRVTNGGTDNFFANTPVDAAMLAVLLNRITPAQRDAALAELFGAASHG